MSPRQGNKWHSNLEGDVNTTEGNEVMEECMLNGTYTAGGDRRFVNLKLPLR